MKTKYRLHLIYIIRFLMLQDTFILMIEGLKEKFAINSVVK